MNGRGKGRKTAERAFECRPDEQRFIATGDQVGERCNN